MQQTAHPTLNLSQPGLAGRNRPLQRLDSAQQVLQRLQLTELEAAPYQRFHQGLQSQFPLAAADCLTQLHKGRLDLVRTGFLLPATGRTGLQLFLSPLLQ